MPTWQKRFYLDVALPIDVKQPLFAFDSVDVLQSDEKRREVGPMFKQVGKISKTYDVIDDTMSNQ